MTALFIVLALSLLAAAAVARIGYVRKPRRRPVPPATAAGDPARTRHASSGQHLLPPADR